MFRNIRSALSVMLATLVVGMGALSGMTAPAFALDYPTHAVKLVVPSTPGGAIDVLSRIIGPRLSTKWGQPVVIENRAGAGGIIGTSYVAHSPPDGSTLLIVTTGFVTNPFLYSRVPYKTPVDFTPVTIIGITPNVLVAYPSLGVHSVKELVAYGKAHPGTLNYGSSGIGSGGHLQMTLFSQMTGVEMTHVPYSGAGAAVTAILSNQTQLLSSAVSAVGPHIKNKSLVPLAVMATKRTDALPDVPTIGEAGLPGYSADGWYGLLGPKGMKPEVVDKLYKDVVEVMQAPDVIAQMKTAGFEPSGMPPADFVQYIDTQLATWQKALATTPPQDIQK